MKKPLLLLALFCAFFGQVSAQKNHAFDVRRIAFDAEKIELQFSLPELEATSTFSVLLKTADPNIVPKTVVGAGQSVGAGKNRRLIWYFAADGFSVEQVTALKKLEIEAFLNGEKTGPQPANPPAKWLAPSLMGVGVGLATIAFITEKKAFLDYKIYRDNLDESASIFADRSREMTYSEANSRHKTAQIIGVVGGVAVLTGCYFLWNRKKAKGHKTGFFTPDSLERGWAVQLSNQSFGPSIRYRF